MLYKDLTPEQKAELKKLIIENDKLKLLMEQHIKRRDNFVKTSLCISDGAFIYFKMKIRKEMKKDTLTNKE